MALHCSRAYRLRLFVSLFWLLWPTDNVVDAYLKEALKYATDAGLEDSSPSSHLTSTPYVPPNPP